MITKQDIENSRKNRDTFLVKNFTDRMPSWNDINKLYDNALNKEPSMFNSFGTMVIPNSQKYCKLYDDFINFFKTLDTGIISNAMTIIHFINRNDNVIKNNDCLNLSKKFYKDNPHPWPQDMKISDFGAEPKENFAPMIHSDGADGFFIQGEGKTLWNIHHVSKF